MSARSRKEQIEEMLSEDPSDTFLRYALAMEHAGAGDDESAVRCLGELLAMDAEYVPAYQQAGQAYARLGRPGQARDLWQKGCAVAQRQGNQHALEEMQGFLASLE